MKTAEREKLYEEIKEYANEEFGIELKDEYLDEYGTEQLVENLDEMKNTVNWGHDEWLLAYVEYTEEDFFEALFRYDEHSMFYNYSGYTVEEIVKNEIWDFVQDCVIGNIMDCLDCEKYLEDCMYFEETEYGYITTW